jgi:Glycosyl transferase family 2
VLAQDRGPDHMHIEVVDHASTADDPAAVVAEVGEGRVAFWRKEPNEGPIANFNTCISRSRGVLVHILHGDDYVADGFYWTIEQMAAESPDVGLYATRHFLVDEESGALSRVVLRVRLPRATGPRRPMESNRWSVSCGRASEPAPGGGLCWREIFPMPRHARRGERLPSDSTNRAGGPCESGSAWRARRAR